MIIGKNRSKIEITHDLLIMCQNVKAKSSIMQKLGMNGYTYQKYFEHLNKRGLLAEIPALPYRKYKTTEKGILLAEKIKEILDQLR